MTATSKCRHSQQTKDFVDQWVQVLDADAKVWDQNAFNQLARSGFNSGTTHPTNRNLFLGWNGKLVIGILPVSAFLSGHTYHVQRLFQVCFSLIDRRLGLPGLGAPIS